MIASLASWWVVIHVAACVVQDESARLAVPDATYTLTLQTSPRLRVAAELSVRGDADGSSAFSAAPMWGGIDHCARYLHELAFLADGKPVAAEHPLETAWVVAHAPGAQLTARWFLDPLTEPLDPKLGNDYRPMVGPKLFHLLGETGLLTPDSLDGETARRIHFMWKGFTEAGWEVASSFGDATEFTRSGTLATFKHAVFIAGAVRRTSRELHGTRLLFALHGAGYSFSDDALVELGTRVVTAERDFFADWSDPLFVVTLIPDERPNQQSLGGTGLTDSFSLFLSKGMSLKQGSDDAARIAHLLAHEYFHHWNGGKIKLEEPEGLGYWFSEGFTDFFARRILLRSSIFDPAEYVRRLDESIEHYWTSPVRHEKNARIAADFWKVKEVGELPYRRGDLVALLLDHEIRATSGGKRSLDDFFREVLQRARERGEIGSTDNLLELAADFTSQEFADRLRGLIVDGNDVEIESDVGAPFLELRTKKIARAGGKAAETVEVPYFELLPGVDMEAARAGL